MSQSSCPLCRRTLPSGVVGLTPGSRLCDQCRSIVQEAFPGPAARLPGSTAAHQNNGPMALVQQGAPTLDLPPNDSSEFIEDGSSVDSFEQEAEFSSPRLFESDDNLKSDFREGDESYAREHSVEAELDMSEDESSQPRAGISNHSGDTKPAPTHNPQAGESKFQNSEQAAILTETVFEDHFDNHIDGKQPAKQAAVIDPWQDPLPSWEYSKSEWPVLMGPAKQNQFGILRASLALLVLLAAAGFYFFILQPTLREQRTSVPVDSKGVDRASAAAQPDVSQPKAAELGPPPVAPPPTSEKPAIVDSNKSKPIQVPEDGNTHGKFSLQAAAFPTQAGASEFAEKLRQAGVPSYTVSADLGRRGRWFRVRVGRFNSVDDAQKFASEAQGRAKAAGMSLQLIGCPYDQP